MNWYCRAANYVLEEGAPDTAALGMWEQTLNLASGALGGLSDEALAEQFAIAGESLSPPRSCHVH